MKRIFSTILAVMLLMGLMAVPALASGLTVVSSSVLDGDEAAPVSALITFKFSENIADVTDNPITLVKDGTDTNLVKSFTGADDVLKIYLDAELEYNTNYTLNLGPVSSTNALNSLSDSEITFKTRYAAEGTIIEEDLEDGGFKELADDLSGKDGAGSLVQKAGDNGNWSYKIQGGTIALTAAAQKVTTIDGKFIFEMDFYPDNVQYDYGFLSLLGSNTADWKAENYTSFETRKLLMYDVSDNKFGVLYNTDSVTSNSSALVAGKELNAGWNNVKALVDLENQTIKLYVNNSLVADGSGNSEFLFPCYSNAVTKGNYLSSFRIHNSKISDGVFSDIYVDNISVRRVNAQSNVDNQSCALVASNPDVNKIVHLDANTFELTFNHNINVHSLENVTINNTAVKSFEADDNKITVVLPDDYQLENGKTYTFDFCLAEDIYGCAVPNVTFNTKINYSMWTVDFQNGYDKTVWEAWRYDKAPAEAILDIRQDPENSSNNALYLKKDAINTHDIRFRTLMTNSNNTVDLGIEGNSIVEFDINTTLGADTTYMTILSVFGYDDNGSITEVPGLFRLYTVEGEADKYQVAFPDWSNATVNTVYSGIYVDKSTWVSLSYEFDFEKLEYTANVKGQKFGPYSFKNKKINAVERVSFGAPAVALELYIDNIIVGQKFFADTQYDFGFFNASGVETDVVDPLKTTYRATIVNRGKSADNTKLILTVTDEAEKRLSEVRLINFADLEEDKNGQNEIIIEEVFENLGAGKKIKAFYWQDFSSLRPSAQSTRLLPIVAEAGSAN